MAWAGGLSLAFFWLALLCGLSTVWVFRASANRRAAGAAPAVAIAGLLVCTVMLALLGLVFLAAANSDSFGR